MERHDVLGEQGVHLLIGAVQENEDKVKPREKGTVHPKNGSSYVNNVFTVHDNRFLLIFERYG